MSTSNDQRNQTSIELISEDGPMPINVMMQEGVKALTKILSNQLQDRKAFENSQHSMQFVIRNGGKSIGDTPRETSPIDAELDEDEIIEIDNKSNYHVNKDPRIIINSDTHDFLGEQFPDPELHINGDEAEIIFDYETQDLSEAPEGIGRRISEMIESVLPNGFGTEAHAKLHAVMNGDELNITEIDNDEEHEEKLHTETKDERCNQETNEPGECSQSKSNEDYSREGYCSHHKHGHGHNQNASKFKSYNYHEFDYISSNSRQSPDFSVLIGQDKPMCMFCEYYMVFGEPPKNMIKWYNNTFGYNRMPSRNRQQHQQDQHRHNQRKRNR